MRRFLTIILGASCLYVVGCSNPSNVVVPLDGLDTACADASECIVRIERPCVEDSVICRGNAMAATAEEEYNRRFAQAEQENCPFGRDRQLIIACATTQTYRIPACEDGQCVAAPGIPDE
jgi:hypothetical protein